MAIKLNPGLVNPQFNRLIKEFSPRTIIVGAKATKLLSQIIIAVVYAFALMCYRYFLLKNN